MAAAKNQVYQEREFLHEIGTSLNAALFIVDRLTEEIKEEEGRLETDAEVEKLFHHLATYLVKIDKLVKVRNTDLSLLLEEEIAKEKAESSTDSPAKLF